MLEKINGIESAVLSGSHSPWFPINIQSISLSLMQSKVKSRKSEYTFQFPHYQTGKFLSGR